MRCPVPDPAYVIAAILVSTVVTWALRSLPFALLAPLRTSALVRYLGVHMPAGVMTVLVVYTITTLDGSPVALVAALAVTAGVHLLRRNVALSMLAGTIVYAVLTGVGRG
jgi:branched-subunit amino acid transport protein AzlD